MVDLPLHQMCLFFFSSRRRHTRCSRDWSSDVCSSDLARIVLCDPHRAVIAGPSPLRGQVVESPDIRAGMAMLLAALAAQGDSVIQNIGQIERGYERIDTRLTALGAQNERHGS